jgi:type IV pilus assembly protein PilY1
MNKPTTLLLAAAALLGALAGARAASAQADVNPPVPNVMLLVDSSGSMEYKSSSEEFPACDPEAASSSNEKSRWIELAEVLTGSINDYKCHEVDRNSAAFKAEYMLGVTPPADFQYVNPYHRPLSGTCAIGPGTMGTNAYDFPSTALTFHQYDNTGSPCTNFSQQNDGILDAFSTRVRFGLMTFDTDPFEGTGVIPMV